MKFDFKNDKAAILRLVALAGALLTLLAVFLPSLTLTSKYANGLDTYQAAGNPLGIDTEKYKSISMASLPSIFSGYSSLSAVAGFLTVLAILVGGFAALSALFSFKKKPVAAIIFLVLSFLIFLIYGNTFTTAANSGDVYTLGIGYYLYIIAAIAALVGAVGMIVTKKKEAPAQPQTF